MSTTSLVKPTGFLPFLFDDLFSPWPDRNDLERFFGRQSVPAANITENKHAFSISVAAPGLTKDDFKIDLRDDFIVISSEKKSNSEDEEMAHANSEADFYYFSRKEIEDYRDLMWKSVLVTIMSTLEQTLNDIADEFSSEFNKPIGQSGRDNNIIKVRHRYFSEQLSIPDNMLDVYYVPITNTIKVRNALVHKSSRLDSSLMQIVRSIPGFVVFTSFGQNYLRIDTPEFLRELSEKVRKYVYDIIDRVDQFHSDQEKIARENGNRNLPQTSSTI